MNGTVYVLQVSASAPLLQGVKKAVRVSVIAMGAAPLAPKEPEQVPDPSAPKEEKVCWAELLLLRPAHMW